MKLEIEKSTKILISRACSKRGPETRFPPQLKPLHNHNTLTVHKLGYVRIPLIAHMLCVLISGYEIITRLLADRHARFPWTGIGPVAQLVEHSSG